MMEENRSLRDQLALKKEPRGASHNEVDPPLSSMNNSSRTASSGQPSALNPLSQIISVGGAREVMPLLLTFAPIIAGSLMMPMVLYSILALLLIAVIWFMARKWWNSQKKVTNILPTK